MSLSFRLLLLQSALGASLVALSGPAPPANAPEASITTLSNQPDRISGGDALVGIDLPDAAWAAAAVIRLNGADAGGTFRPGAAPQGGHRLTGLVTGLTPGRNVLEIFRPGETVASAQVVLTNHPISGPVFSGPHEQPFMCQTEEFKLPDGTSLGPPLDGNCSVRTRVHYVYRAKTGDVRPLPKLDAVPADVAVITTSLGQTVPYIVRIETGTINRSIYQLALLHDPFTEPEPSAFVPPPAWNRRLLYSFGGGCPGGWYKQGVRLAVASDGSGTGIVSDAIVGKGYASVSATLNVFGNNCQDVTAAETMMMVKEHFIETYGVPLFTFGRGGSGGSYQQIQIADNYPGLLDGIIPSATFPDVLATIQFLADVQLLDRYFKGNHALTGEQKRAIAGVGVLRTVAQTAPGAKRIQATGGCPPELPPTLRYDPVRNRSGARCDVFDHTVNVYGRDPATGFARRPVDNVGVQYGLAALNDGVITAAQFLDLNEKIGGYDNDGNMIANRAEADPQALRAAYETGRVTHGGGGLARVPIIDSRAYLDLNPAGDLHLKYHSFSFRERLLRANGTIGNQVLLVTGDKPPRGHDAYTIAKMDEWLTNLFADRSGAPTAEKIAGARPADLVDSCYPATGDRIVEPQTFSGGKCSGLYPAFPSPQMIAGGPATNDVLKCRLTPVDLAGYRVPFTADEEKRLKAIFPDGVCDWTVPGVEQRQGPPDRRTHI